MLPPFPETCNKVAVLVPMGNSCGIDRRHDSGKHKPRVTQKQRPKKHHNSAGKLHRVRAVSINLVRHNLLRRIIRNRCAMAPLAELLNRTDPWDRKKKNDLNRCLAEKTPRLKQRLPDRACVGRRPESEHNLRKEKEEEKTGEEHLHRGPQIEMRVVLCPAR